MSRVGPENWVKNAEPYLWEGVKEQISGAPSGPKSNLSSVPLNGSVLLLFSKQNLEEILNKELFIRKSIASQVLGAVDELQLRHGDTYCLPNHAWRLFSLFSSNLYEMRNI
ncbi:hypothetical protein MKW98_006909 [Papaver atlanticum]|uniref:Uncharacterized protein n=1 Tax=Papaver atlanticum TaxID=357466 RepID=A0AAD4SVC6_9MAGN|nr:hypothetical protein MKW98_006909 [Papaver atlanticum]